MTTLLTSPPLANPSAANSITARPRLDSIDVLRGLIMVIMALDHVRDYFSGDTMSPEDLSVTTPALFFGAQREFEENLKSTHRFFSARARKSTS